MPPWRPGSPPCAWGCTPPAPAPGPWRGPQRWPGACPRSCPRCCCSSTRRRPMCWRPARRSRAQPYSSMAMNRRRIAWRRPARAPGPICGRRGFRWAMERAARAVAGGSISYNTRWITLRPRPSCSTPMSTVMAVAARYSIGHSFHQASTVPSFCLGDSPLQPWPMAFCKSARVASRWRLMSAPASRPMAPMASRSRASRTPGKSNASSPPCARPTHNLHEIPMTSYRQPDAAGHFGPYGGSFVSETLTLAIAQLRTAYARYQNDPEFLAEFGDELKHFVGRPAPIYHAARSSREIGGAQIYLKREDLNHTGAHKINNVIGQAMLARRMGKPRVIAETGAGQHGVAAATICARYGLECVVYMGAHDVRRQSPNVYRMKLLGATVVPVESGSRTLKDALNEAMRDWVTHVDDTFYIIGSVAGPHPYPMMVRDFQSIIGKECIEQMPAILAPNTAARPDARAARPPRGRGAAAGGGGWGAWERGSGGVGEGGGIFVLQDANGQIPEPRSISAGLDYPGVGPEHAWLQQIGRAEYVGITDQEAL